MSIKIVTNNGMLSVSARYLHKVSGSDNYYFIRRLPAAVLRVLKAKGETPKAKVVITTGTSNRQRALKEAYRINREVEAEWDALLTGRPSAAHVSSGQALYQRYNEQPYNLSDYLDSKLSPQANHEIHELHHSTLPKDQRQEEIDSILQEQLTTAEWQAVMLARGQQLWTLSIIKDEYLKLKGWDGDRKQRNSVEGAFSTVIEAFGDITPNSISRLEVHQLIRSLVDSGLKTATIKRKLSVVRSAINYISKMQEVSLNNPFTNVEIPRLLEDAEDRVDFTSEQLTTVRSKLTKRLQDGSSNQVDGLIAIMIDTGMRVSEVVGLRFEDIVLDAEVPYISLHRNSMRRLKTKSSKRLIPLVGTALEWVTQGLGEGSGFIFDKYVNEEQAVLKNDTASATANKRLKAWVTADGKMPTCHSFRHTMATRLRDAQCPKDIREELGGWAKSISDNYGSPTDLKIKQEYLEASI